MRDWLKCLIRGLKRVFVERLGEIERCGRLWQRLVGWKYVVRNWLKCWIRGWKRGIGQ